jgi:hypothetical protein
MWKIIVFILLFPFNSMAQDALLEAMFKNWKSDSDELEDNYQHEPEIYHWELGVPDNSVEIEIIYEDFDPCRY